MRELNLNSNDCKINDNENISTITKKLIASKIKFFLN